MFSHHHLPPLLLLGSLAVGQARVEVPLHVGGGADGGSPAPQACQCGLPSHLAVVLSTMIWDLVTAVTPPGYKLVCSVSIGSEGQGNVAVSSQSLWDPHEDSSATSH